MHQTPLDDLDLIGLTTKQARKYAQKHGWNLRILKNDGVDTARTHDYKSNRVNVEVILDKVYDILGVG